MIFTADCFEYDTSYLTKHRSPQKPMVANSAGECQKLCQRNQTCKIFSYDTDRKHCWMVSYGDMKRGSISSYISGPKYCSGTMKNKPEY